MSFNLSAASVRDYLSRHCERRDGVLIDDVTGRRVKALMPVHLYGRVADMDAMGSLAREYGIAVIEDAAQAIGAEDSRGRRAGSMGDVGCLSFFPTKNLGAFGDAGMCVAQDADLARHMAVLRVHGGEPKYFHSFIGGNFRLDELQAAVLNVKLRMLDEWTAGRQRNAAIYDGAFAAAALGQVRTPDRGSGARHIYNQYVVRVERRDDLRQFLASRDIGTEIYYPVPLHLQKCFGDLGYREGDLPESERAARETLALPIFPELSPEQLHHVVDSIAEFYS